eukprot:scaffold141_cov410-Prasinococcus_capsulatus_cf.AAC.2
MAGSHSADPSAKVSYLRIGPTEGVVHDVQVLVYDSDARQHTLLSVAASNSNANHFAVQRNISRNTENAGHSSERVRAHTLSGTEPWQQLQH